MASNGRSAHTLPSPTLAGDFYVYGGVLPNGTALNDFWEWDSNQIGEQGEWVRRPFPLLFCAVLGTSVAGVGIGITSRLISPFFHSRTGLRSTTPPT